MGLPQQLRLRRSADFERMRHKGKAYRHRWMLISVLPNQLAHNRYGFAVGKKMGKAVIRNRIRRLLREAVRALHPRLRVGYDIVIVPNPVLIEQPLDAIQRTIDELMQQAGLHNP